ncbi:hypothetical protein VTJ83DRAFT_7069 [Remersonia thermophila]|uniref:Glucose-methanol-choline oxidoreductase N-terminal domain-containing protein n=1 Tax=Remersonia thermophila TaxID=72144 RepID=A0ABR4D3H7_9PEZI
MGLVGVAVVSLAAAAGAARVPPQHHVKRQVAELRESYDFVIAGGGTAGLTVADRLSAAFPSKNVLVIEYGDIHAAPGLFDPPTNWIEPHPDEAPRWTLLALPSPDMGNARASVQAGQTVGGSSAVNGQFFDRGAKQDYDAWHELGGLEALLSPNKWNWNGIFPYFKKSVTFTEPSPSVAARYGYTWSTSAYGGTGPIWSTYAPFQWADQKILTQAWHDLGVPDVRECAGGRKEGVCWVPASQHPVTGERSHSGVGHYADAQPRANYDLLVRHQVVRVAYGAGGPLGGGAPRVEVRSLDGDGGGLFNVTVRGEVILSAGALHTPTILQRSGIGPAAFLAGRGVPVVVDLPGVGSNLQDHSGPPVTWNYTAPYAPGAWPLPSEVGRNATFKAEATAAFAATPAAGPYTLGGGNSAVYASLPRAAGRAAAARIARKIRKQVLDGSARTFLPADLRGVPAVVAGYKAQLLVLARALEDAGSPSVETPWATAEGPVTAWSFLLRPLSRGTVRLDPADPLAPPVLDYRAGANPVDMDLHRAHLRFVRQLVATPTLQQFGAAELAPGAAVAGDDEALAAYIRDKSFLSFMHPCGTAAMMPRSLGGVVGYDLKVHGTKGLRVADASIMPLEPAAHLSATTYAIGEKAADIIIAEWKKKKGW